MLFTKNQFKWIIWVLVATFYFYEYILRVSPGVMAHTIMDALDISATTVSFIFSCFFYSYSPLQLPVGIIIDRYGIRGVLSTACIVCGIGTGLFAFSYSVPVAALARLGIGAGSAFAFVSMVYVTSNYFEDSWRGFLIGVGNSIAMLGAAVGTGPLGTMLNTFGWRAAFVGFGLFGVTLGLVLYIIFSMSSNKRMIKEKKDDDNPHLFEYLLTVIKHKYTWINAFLSLLFYATTTSFGGLWGVSYLTNVYHLPYDEASYAIMLIFVGWGIGGPLMGMISDYVHSRITIIRISIILSLCIFVTILLNNDLPIALLCFLLTLLGVCLAAQLLTFSLSIEMHPVWMQATAIAFTNLIVSIGDGFGQVIVGMMLDSQWTGQIADGMRIYSSHAYTFAMLYFPICLTLAGLLSYFLKKKHSVKQSG